MIEVTIDEFLQWIEENYPYAQKFTLKSLIEPGEELTLDKWEFKKFIKDRFPTNVYIKEQVDLENGIWKFNIKNKIESLVYNIENEEALIAIIGIYNKDRDILEKETYIYIASLK